MTPNKFQRLFLRQYRELHESKARKQILATRLLKISLGSVVIVGAMTVFLYFAGSPACMPFVIFGVGLILGNSATNLGALIRRAKSWEVVEEITDWPKVYDLLGDKEACLKQ